MKLQDKVGGWMSGHPETVSPQSPVLEAFELRPVADGAVNGERGLPPRAQKHGVGQPGGWLWGHKQDCSRKNEAGSE